MAYDTTILDLILLGTVDSFAQANAQLAAGHPNAFINTVGAAATRAASSLSVTIPPGTLTAARVSVELTDATAGAEHGRLILSVLRAGSLAPVLRVDSTGKVEVNGGSGWKSLRVTD